MINNIHRDTALMLLWVISLGLTPATAQSLGGAGTLRGKVRDATDAGVPSAAIVLSNPVT